MQKSDKTVDLPEVRELITQGRVADALAVARAAHAAAGQDPAYAYWIGIALAYTGDAAQAARWLQAALAADPDDARAHAALGFVGRALGRWRERSAHYARAAQLLPGDADLRANYAEALIDAGDAPGAEAQAARALTLKPGHVGGTVALSRALQAQGRAGEGIALLRSALRAGNDRDIAWALADALLRAGRWREGYVAFEARRRPSRRAPHVADPGLSKPEWRGDALAGRTLLVVQEQGLGDTLQGLRYAARLAAGGACVSAVVGPALEPLLAAQPFLRKVYRIGAPIPRQAFDCWCFALSLPGLLGEDGSQPQFAYLALPPREQPLERKGKELLVGLCWSGSTQNPADGVRSIPVADLDALAGVRNVRFVSCQHGAGALPAFIEAPPRTIGDLADTAALLGRLDLLVSIDSAPAHLAGALGREVWMLHRWFGDARWETAGEATFWYASMRVLRQERRGDWASVLARVCRMLEERAGAL